MNPSGEATPLDGGFELSGHWQYGTGVVHADWVILSGMVPGEEAPMSRMFLIPAGDVEVKDTWHVDGMAATGSRDIIARSVFVPARRVSNPPPPTWLLGRDEPYLRRIPMLPFLALTAAIPSLGCARRSVELFERRMTDRILFGTTKRQAETAPAQIRLANLVVRTAIAENTMRTAAREMAAHARGEAQLSLLDHLQMRVTIAHVVRMCRDIVRDVMEASGAGAHFLDNELQRIHRDMHMISAHTVFDVDAAALHYGRELLRDRAAPTLSTGGSATPSSTRSKRATSTRSTRCYAPEMTLWFNATGETMTRADNLAALVNGRELHRRRTYNDRIVNTFDDGFVAQYTVNVVTHKGSEVALSACLVAEVRDGKITKLFEYLDSGKFGRR